MRMFKATLCAAGLVLLLSAAWAKDKPKPITVNLQDGKGQAVGTAELSNDPHGVKIKLNVKNLAAGEHGIHVHQVAKCEGPDFKSAGPHFNPDSKKHGLQNPEGPHAGDMKNLTVGADGTAHIEFADTLVSLAEDVPNSLFHPKGTAIVIHADPDDEMTDPSGKSGARIACGVISK